MTTNKSSSSIIDEKRVLDALCSELELQDIKYLPSPKERSGSISDLTKHAIEMLTIYKRFKNGDKTAPVKEIFTEE